MTYSLARTSRAAIAAVALAAMPCRIATAQDTSARKSASAAAPATIRHTVKKGDTLWDIARYYLKDPFKWPEVFHANTDIVKNPHWIYPGQVLTIDADAVKPEIAAKVTDGGTVVAQIQTRAQAPTVFAPTTSPSFAQNVKSTTIPPALTVRAGEYAAAPYVISSRHAPHAGQIVGPVDIPALGLKSDAGFKLFDRVYVSFPADQSLTVGEHVTVGRDESVITDIGRVVEPSGVIRIDSMAGSGRAIGTIISQFASISSGQRIFGMGQSFEATTVRPVRGAYPLTAKLLWIQGSPRLPAVQTYVILGATEADGVRIGDQFTLLDDRARAQGGDAPVEGTATVTIVRVTPFASTGIIVNQVQPEVRAGMPARLSAKMP